MPVAPRSTARWGPIPGQCGETLCLHGRRRKSPLNVASALLFAIGLVSGCSKGATLPSSCAATQMTPQLTPLGGAASQDIWQLALNNKSHSTCLFEGFLGVYAQDKNHQNIAFAHRGTRRCGDSLDKAFGAGSHKGLLGNPDNTFRSGPVRHRHQTN